MQSNIGLRRKEKYGWSVEVVAYKGGAGSVVQDGKGRGGGDGQVSPFLLGYRTRQIQIQCNNGND